MFTIISYFRMICSVIRSVATVPSKMGIPAIRYGNVSCLMSSYFSQICLIILCTR